MRIAAILLLLIIAGPTYADPTGSETIVRQAVEKFLDLNQRQALNGKEAKALFAGELEDWTEPTIGTLSGPDKIVMIDANSAIVRIQAHDVQETIDVYLYLEQSDQVWRIEAMRALAMTGWIRASRDYLQQLPERNQKQEAELRRANLILSTDRQLIDWFRLNKGKIEALVARAHPYREQNDQDPEIADRLAELGISGLWIEDREMILMFGGMLDNTVGFLRRTDGTTPVVGEKGIREYIWVEPVGDGWFLFRTS